MRETSKEGNTSSRLTHEVLRQSLPSKTFQSPSKLSLSRASKWVLHSDLKNAPSVSHEALNPLRAYVSLPRVTFGPKSLLPNTDSSVLASTANELRRDKYTPVNPKKLKAAAVGLSQNTMKKEKGGGGNFTLERLGSMARLVVSILSVFLP
ncbi:unnamed protein product [Camellia sinensis]